MKIFLLLFLFLTVEVIAQTDTLRREEVTHVALIGGGTEIFKTSKFVGALGAGFEYQYLKDFGGGVNLMGFFGDDFEFAVSLPIYYHPSKTLRFWGAPGIAYTSSISYSLNTPEVDDQGNPILITDEKSKLTGNFFISFGCAYDIPFSSSNKRFVVSPFVSFDLINVETLYLTLGLRLEMQFFNYKPIIKR